MSWGAVIVTASPTDALASALDDAAQAYIAQLEDNDYTLDDDAKQSLKAGQDAAVALAQSGGLGEGPFTVTLSGHANPGHKPVPGYANDFLQLTITSAAQVEAAPTATAPDTSTATTSADTGTLPVATEQSSTDQPTPGQ